MRKLYVVLLALCSFVSANAQLSGTKTIPGDYPTIAAAVLDLNAQGVGAGGVIFNVNAGHIESSADSIYLTASGTATSTITFQKSGAGANPIVTRSGAGLLTTSTLGGGGDAVILIEGSDFVTFDGINVTTANQGIEYGYFLRKASATDGCKNVTIKNSDITLTKGTSAFVVGVYVSNNFKTQAVNSATGITVTSTGGRNENVSLLNNTISNVFAGIVLRGFNHTTAPNDFYDQNHVVTNNTISNFAGNSASTSYGVYLIYQNGANVSSNNINNVAGGGSGATSTFYGIFMSTGTGSSLNASNNIIDLTTSSATSGLFGVYNSSGSGTITFNGNNVTLNTAVANSGTIGYIYNGNVSTGPSFNNNIINGTALNSTGTIYLIYNSNSNTGIVSVQGNQVMGTLSRTGTSGTTYGYYNNGSPAGVENISGNIFSNISQAGTTTFYGIYSTTAAAHTQNIFNNTVSNVATGSGGGAGIYMTSANTRSVNDNRVFSISSTGGTYYGIYSGSGSTNHSINKNKVYDISAGGTTSAAHGIYLAGGTNISVHNNLIADIKAPSSSLTAPAPSITGIYSTATPTTVGIYYNTVFINGSSSGANFGSAAVYTSTTPTVDLRNNNLVNTSIASGTGKTVVYQRSSITLTTYASTSNNNNFYAGTPSSSNLIFFDGTNSDQTIDAYKTRVSARDAASVSVMPVFLSTVGANANFLHIDLTVASPLESGGIPVTGITEDFDGNTRNSSTPDIGADEFNGISADISAPLISFTPFSFTCSTADRVLSVIISDASGVPTSGAVMPRLYYRKAGGAWQSVAGVLASGTGTNGTWNFTLPTATLGTLTPGDVIEYYIIAQDVASTPNISSSPTGVVATNVNTVTTAPTPNSYVFGGPLSGTISVGAGQTYTTITQAVDVYNNFCLSGPVVFQLTDATYGAGETFPLNITANPFNSSTNTLEFRPAPGITTTISGTVANGALIRLLGADNIIFDGSNAGGTDRNLTITNLATAAPTDIAVISQGTGAGATNVTLKNLNLTTGASTTVGYGIAAGGSTPGTSGADNDNLVISNNVFTNISTGIYAVGTAEISAGGLDNMQITGNQITSNVTTATAGIRAGNALNATISGNTISLQTTATGAPTAIGLEAGFNNSNVFRNNITKANTSATGGYGGRGIAIGTGLTASNVNIYNNFISGVNGSNWNAFTNSSSIGIAIGVAGNSTTITTVTGGVNVYHNSVNLYGTYSSTTSSVITTAMFIGSGASNINIVNNIFANSLTNTGTGTTPKSFAIYSAAANTAFNTINNNDYYVEGAQGVLGFLSSDRANIAAIQTGFGQNTASVNIKPEFVSNSDLHLNPALAFTLDNLGVGLTSVTADYDGDTRNVATPDMGADEFSSPTCTGAVGGDAVAASTTATCGTGSTTISATGFSTGVGSVYQWQSSTDNVNFTDISGQVTPASLNTGTLTDTTYFRLKVTCNTGTALAYSDTVTVTVNPLPVFSATSTATAAICAGETVVLNAVGNANTYSWTPATGLSGTTGASVSASPMVTTSYVVTGTITATGCTLMDTVVVEVKPLTVVTAMAADDTICAGASVQLNSTAALLVNTMRITEVTVNKGGTGTTPTYPSYIPTAAADFVEISNISTQSFNIGGMTLSAYGDNSATVTHSVTFPAGTVVPANGVVVVHLGSGTDVPASFYYNTGGSSDSYFSTSKIGLVLKSGASVVDAVGLGGSATGTFTFHPSTGVTATDFSGAAPNGSGLAGSIRTGPTDTNTGANWTASSAALPQSIGTYNSGYTNIQSGTFTYQWLPSTGLSNNTIANPIATPAVTTTYILQVTETGTACSAFDTLLITVNQPPVITSTTANQNLCIGSAASFDVVATGEITSIKWQKGGVDIAGATGDTYSIPSVTATDAGVYSVIVTNDCGADTANITLTVSNATSITTQPTSQTLCAGTVANFTVVAAGGGTLSYQWKKNGVAITGATSATYTINNLASTDAGTYSVEVIGTCGTVTSANATLVVNAATIITTEPSALTVCNGSSGNFSVVASGTNLTYQWQKDGVNITGQTTASIAFTLASAANGGTYRVVVNGLCGADTSAAVTLTVTDAPSITTQPVAVAACPGASATFTVGAAGSGLTYQWRRAGVNISGATSASYTIPSVSAATAGNYDVVVSSNCGTVTSNAVALTLNAVTLITAEPNGLNICSGAAANFSVNATGAGTLTYQWRKGGVNIAGATASTFNIPAASATDAASYDVIVNGTCGADTSAVAVLAVKAATTITTQPAAQTVCLTTQTTFSVVATGSGTLTYQWRKNGVNIAGAVTNSYVILGAQAGDAGNYDVVITGECGSVTSAVATLTVNTCTSIPVVDTDITEVKMLPNIVNGSTVLRVKANRAMKTDWIIIDANGKTVMSFSRQLQPGTNDFRIFLGNLANGNYYLVGETTKGRIGAVRFIRL